MPVIDFHSHVLPGLDDGSRNVETSLAMLRRSAEQGVEVMAATSHFYAWRDRPERFLERRARAWEQLQAALEPEMPRLYLGSEVAFFEGISQAAQVDRLCLEGTDVLLLEMPFRPWSGQDVDEVEDLLVRRGFRVVLAHLERYLPMRENRSLIQELLELPALVQINAESLLEWRGRGRVLRLFRDGKAHLLGSDCHGVEFRPPNLGQGRAVLSKKLGPKVLAQIDRTGAGLLPEVKK